uniref:Uncharacterized protein n=1 Tax=Lepeophtheirus salmonis TaxID=72036 RepID=A0A0K2UC89_LEPSM
MASALPSDVFSMIYISEDNLTYEGEKKSILFRFYVLFS